jgi:hypothetical protein
MQVWFQFYLQRATMSRYKNQIRDARKWALIEAGYNDDMTAEEKKVCLARVDELMDEVHSEMRLVEEDEENTYARYDRKYRRNMDDAA